MMANEFSLIIITILHASFYSPTTSDIQFPCDIQSRNFPKPYYWYELTDLSERTDDGWTGYVTINIEFNLDSRRSKEGIFIINSMHMNGSVIHNDGTTQILDTDFDGLSYFRFQHTLLYVDHPEYPFVDICTIGFVKNEDSIRDFEEQIALEILDMAETCVQDYICHDRFLAEDVHRLRDNFYIQGRSRYEKSEITLQSDVNAVFDFVLTRIINSMIKDNKSIITVGELEFSDYEVTVKGKSGYVDAIAHVERLEDFEFYHADYQYTFASIFGFKSGKVQIDGFEATSMIKDFRGTFLLNLTNSKIALEVTIDYNNRPCKIYITKCQFEESDNFLDFSGLTTKVLFFDRPADLFLSPFKPVITNFLRGLISDTIKNQILKYDCLNYRDIVYNDAQKLFEKFDMSMLFSMSKD